MRETSRIPSVVTFLSGAVKTGWSSRKTCTWSATSGCAEGPGAAL
jgi:hypothetical protein